MELEKKSAVASSSSEAAKQDDADADADADSATKKPKKRVRGGGSGGATATDKRRFRLRQTELDRIQRLLQRSVDKEAGKAPEESELSEDNPDGRESQHHCSGLLPGGVGREIHLLRQCLIVETTVFLFFFQWTFPSTRTKTS